MPRSPRRVIHLDYSLADSDNGRGVVAEPDLMILRTDASATPPLTAARCSVQIGRTGAIARGASSLGSLPVKASAQAEAAWCMPAAREPTNYFLLANRARQFVGIPIGIARTRRRK